MDGRIIILKERIQKNPEKAWTISEMAQSIGLSESHLQKIFKEVTGETPARFVKNLRLEIAKDLLERIEYFSVKEVRMKIGIMSGSHFTRDFKEKFDLSPTEYRKKFWEIYAVNIRNGNK